MSGSGGSGFASTTSGLNNSEECYIGTSILSSALALAFVLNSVGTLLSTRYWPRASEESISESIQRLLDEDAHSDTSVVDDGHGGTELAVLPVAEPQVDMDAIESASNGSHNG